ncbi:hypothetical protein VTK56DRAFT_7398 [Thermocarpiscus australiensis]
MADSSDPHESITVGVAESAVPSRKTPNADGDDVAAELITHGSGSSTRPTSQKRKAVKIRKPAPTKKPRGAPAVPKKSAQDKKWEAPFVLADPKSPLAHADLRAILLLPEAWEVLTEEEKQDVLAKFPDETHIQDPGTKDARPNPESLRNDDNFRHDCARYCENIELGRHDEEWLSQAWIAHEKHRRGDFDGFLREQFEEDWGIKLPDDNQAEDAESAHGSKIGSSSPMKQELPDSAELAQPPPTVESQETSAPIHSSERTSPSTQPAVGGSSPRNLQNDEDHNDQGQNLVTRQVPQPQVPMGNSESNLTPESPSHEPNVPSGNPRDEEKGSCIIVALVN